MITILKEDEIENETAESIGTHIASVFNKGRIEQAWNNKTDHFTYRNVVSDQAELLPLSHYLLGPDLVRLFLTMYDTEENEGVDLLQEDDLLSTFFGTAERGRLLLQHRYLHASPTASSDAMKVDRPARYAYQDQVLIDALDDATHQIDVVQTAVPNVFVSWSTRLDSNHREVGPSNLTPLMDYFDCFAKDYDLMTKLGIQGFLNRRVYDELNPTKRSNCILKYKGRIWPAMITITREESTPEKVGTYIAKAFTDFTNKKFNLQSKKRQFQYVFRNNATDDDKPSPLSKYLTDYGVVGVFMSMYGSNNKKEIMKCDELLVAFFGDPDRGRRMLKYTDFGDTAQKSQSILDDYGYTATTTNDEEQAESNTTTPQTSADSDVNAKVTIDNLQISHTQSVIRQKRCVTDESSVGEESDSEESDSDNDTYGDDTELALEQLDELGFD